jgi:hypothetical protein
MLSGEKALPGGFTGSNYIWLSMTVGRYAPFALLPAMWMTETLRLLTVCAVN